MSERFTYYTTVPLVGSVKVRWTGEAFLDYREEE